MTPKLPAGRVTLLFTDIEGSTRLLQELGRDRYIRALSDQRRIVREVFTRNGGVEVEMQGDSFHFAFVSWRPRRRFPEPLEKRRTEADSMKGAECRWTMRSNTH